MEEILDYLKANAVGMANAKCRIEIQREVDIPNTATFYRNMRTLEKHGIKWGYWPKDCQFGKKTVKVWWT